MQRVKTEVLIMPERDS